MNFANILGIITTITELIVPGHPTCSVTGQVYNETELPILKVRLKDIKYLEERGGNPKDYEEFKFQMEKENINKRVSSGEISPRRPYDPIISANITERLYLEV